MELLAIKSKFRYFIGIERHGIRSSKSALQCQRKQRAFLKVVLNFLNGLIEHRREG